jgi:hypothetical protein
MVWLNKICLQLFAGKFLPYGKNLQSKIKVSIRETLLIWQKASKFPLGIEFASLKE